MEFHGTTALTEDEDLRRGPWTVEEDILLMNYITAHGEGRWNSLARSAGLKRTGKSCRLRWLNYLRPDVRRGNITPEEQLLILELHSRFGNRWSKIAQHLPGRTDNEIKNYWRTRVQKHAKQLRCDVNSKQFKDVMRHLWMPRLVERIRAASGDLSPAAYSSDSFPTDTLAQQQQQQPTGIEVVALSQQLMKPTPESSSTAESSLEEYLLDTEFSPPQATSEISFTGNCDLQGNEDWNGDRCWMQEQQLGVRWWAEQLPLPSPGAYGCFGLPELEQGCGWGEDNLWSMEDIWLQQQF